MFNYMSDFINWILGIFQGMGYVGIFIMMMIESSFIPFPSEVAMIPAGALAHKWEMNIFFILLSGTFGAWCGASINYFLGRYLWAPAVKILIQNYGKYFFLKMLHYEYAENFFQKNGGKTTFFGRFIPAVRQLISIPAGVFRMNFWIFSLFTILGALIWNIILVAIGYFAFQYQDMILHNLKVVVLLLLWFVIIYFIWRFLYKKRKSS